ncbi:MULTISPECIES: hypothetical protein [Streptomyces]|nr:MULTISPECIES: hypothetical protein [Streptomyces]MBP5921184.1 hypothetical protein [Streptomyces sp. LBUM 1483]MDX2579781.1 hypothetical protein [Streptomyces scabiei]MDX2657275.1 hypothetical protein [Streptomyces scabiei]MDX2690300.1 hypothetical protein [Streptomyces scabiei]MDX2725415.1 hypothetical protein [Streptomyces scabiei]
MHYKVWDAHAVEAFGAAPLTRQQRAFLEGLLRMLDPRAYATEHVSAVNSALLTLIRVHHALEGNVSAERQPVTRLLKRLTAPARVNMDTASLVFAAVPDNAQHLRAARRLVHTLEATLTDSTPDHVKRNYAARLGRLIAPASRSVRDWLVPLWESRTTPGAAVTLRNEIAVAVALHGRDGLDLRTDLIALLKRTSPHAPTAEQLAAVLWPAERPFRVGLVVTGTRELKNLDLLLPGARQQPVPRDAEPPHEAQRQDTRRRFLSRIAAGLDGPAALVTLPVHAADTHTALRRGRRKLSEVLDQYAAGQRLSRLSLHPLLFATDTSAHVVHDDARSKTTKAALPLTTHWPASLGPALRAAHLAQQVDAPMTTAGLVWSAVESVGMKSAGLDILAKACALHAARQQLLGLWQVVLLSAQATVRHAAWHHREYERRLARLARSMEKVKDKPAPSARRAHEEMSARHSALLAQADEARTTHDHLTRETDTLLQALMKVILKDGGDSPDHGPNGAIHLNRWFAVLAPPEGAPADIRSANSSLATLVALTDGLAAEQVATWQRRLAHPAEFATWLHDQQNTIHTQLTWLYAMRNAAFHQGVFAKPADELTAQSALGLIDTVLEFLGHWSKKEVEAGLPLTRPYRVLEQLAARQTDLQARLNTDSTSHPLDLDHITAPPTTRP